MMIDANSDKGLRPRRANQADAEACADILNAWIDATDWMPRIHPADDVRRHNRDVVLADRELWVIGAPVHGYLALDPETNTATALYVAIPGQGIGKALLDFAKGDHERLQLWTFQANKAARRFYAREGFVEVRMTNGDNEEGLPDVLLEWVRNG